MALFQVTNIFIANTKAKAADVNQNFTDVLAILTAHHHDPNKYTGASPVTTSGIAPNAEILDTQLHSPITRSGLISDTALQNVDVPRGGVGMASAVAGDLIYADTTNHYSRLPIGAPNQTLAVSAGNIPFWKTATNPYFGGNGADGALAISSGTTTLDLGGANFFVKNYTSISITGTGNLAFSNPANGGTIIVLKSQGAVTITTNSAYAIDLRNLGGLGGAGGPLTGGWDAGGGGGGGASASSNGSDGANNMIGNYGGYSTSGTGYGYPPFGGIAQTGGTARISSTGYGGVGGISPQFNPLSAQYHKYLVLPGSGASGGGGVITKAGGDGGRGAGALYMECGGTYTFTTGTINAGGTAGGTGGTYGGGGGGGGGGSIIILYTTLGTDSGTYTVSGGAGGTTSYGNGGSGANGYVIHTANTDFF